MSVFSQVPLLRQLVSFGPSNRLYYLLAFSVNLVLGVLIHKGVEKALAWYDGRKRAAVSVG